MRKYFRLDSPCTGNTFSGQKIIGIYRGSSEGLGCWIFGIIDKQTTIPEMHKVTRTSLEHINQPKLKSSSFTLDTGVACTGQTPKGEVITGKFMQVAGPKFAWIKNSLDNQATKVLRHTVRKHG